MPAFDAPLKCDVNTMRPPVTGGRRHRMEPTLPPLLAPTQPGYLIFSCNEKSSLFFEMHASTYPSSPQSFSAHSRP